MRSDFLRTSVKLKQVPSEYTRVGHSAFPSWWSALCALHNPLHSWVCYRKNPSWHGNRIIVCQAAGRRTVVIRVCLLGSTCPYHTDHRSGRCEWRISTRWCDLRHGLEYTALMDSKCVVYCTSCPVEEEWMTFMNAIYCGIKNKRLFSECNIKSRF